MAASSPLPASLPFSSPASSRFRRASFSQLAFLVHSQESVANHMPPDVDNKALARQKRRRTSKEDEDILKSYYLKNPKPDKTARLEIVTKVALGEKEVQIWFQNKRQNERRRSRPLEPSSTASLMSSSSTMSDPPTEDETVAIARNIDTLPELEEEECPKSDPPEHPATPELTSDETIPEPRTVDTTVSATAERENVNEAVVEPSTEVLKSETAPTELANSQRTAPSSQGAPQPRTSWISNRRSASFVRSLEDYTPEVITFPNAPTKPFESPDLATKTPSRSLKRKHSFVRLSTTEDGTARIVTDLDKTPSPPKSRKTPASFSRAAAGIRRSYSTAGLNDRLAAAGRGEPSPRLPRTVSNIGRSRDSRAWEFWCDPESRSATSLTTRAEQEESGSAADAIGILRANRNRRILAQNQARQNSSPLMARHSSHKVQGSPLVKKSRGPMQRASTINGRLSNIDHSDYKKGGESTESDDFPQTESDKENWEPGADKSVCRDRQVAATPPASRAARQILGENTKLMSKSSSLGALLVREKRGGDKGFVDPEQDDELRLFMNGDGASGRSSINSAEEAGCVEGLLKLSQGQWR
ncbi:Homeodomain-containing transcription factor [Pyrenophora tritici-repentis]|uniref:AF-4 domain containing protein n=1 Tax=Pyrenophora tritici-repentis TaxID=45151 RepID=A0A834S028_9PLEO|nr:AF-4 domain containing protein [Pyrenophora tritici-repentis]KAI0583517.1 Homeodomain-containing transcription factor [Pyrenophora tritici-repentis]KAI0610233.1 Homeodomain-containing transcription factor [Pyrenophora tritici-repentis]KAI0620977.1 Homeodomain-containing transcription factor [Pyrenophora tritici-repentis]KAI1516194.1 Homeodomain-containing transcription factor [Pyrenophora tritici-repentis]